MFDLNGKTALVTGASGAIGGAIARALHAQGATVAISGTRKDALDTLAGEMTDRVHVLPCDLADKDAVEKLVPDAEAAMEKLDILVANAGVNRDNLFVQLSDKDWDQVIAVNLTATFRLTRAAVKTMMRRRWGRVIAISSVVGVTGNPGQGNYAASKAGLAGMMKTVAAEYARPQCERRHGDVLTAGRAPAPALVAKRLGCREVAERHGFSGSSGLASHC
jgi:3-oxoacyl-[acyl-carrier protein] reductase